MAARSRTEIRRAKRLARIHVARTLHPSQICTCCFLEERLEGRAVGAACDEAMKAGRWDEIRKGSVVPR